MKFLRLNSHDPYLNLAIEEYLFKYERGDIIMLWQNEPSVIIGKNQNAYCEVNSAYAKSHGIKTVRRVTGGGAVYHDLGNLNYSFISDRGGEEIDFASFSLPIIEAVGSLGVKLTLGGRNDLLGPDGRKVSGAAQRREGGRVLHHGTLLIDTDFDSLCEVLTPDEEKVKSKAVGSVRARVGNLSQYIPDFPGVNAIIDRIEENIKDRQQTEDYILSYNEEINELYKRNSSQKWIYPDREYLSRYSISKKKRYDFGLVEIRLDMQGEIIKSAEILGDFFGNRDTRDITGRLVAKTLDEAAEFIKTQPVSEYVFGMTPGELSGLLSQ
jgi:lipoate-protein ligase A